jgi:hypothetical protein
VALAVESEEELHGWAARLDAAGVHHSGVKVTPATGSALIAFRDPDNLQLEMYVAQGATARQVCMQRGWRPAPSPRNIARQRDCSAGFPVTPSRRTG